MAKVVVLASLAFLVACVTIDYPQPGKPVELRKGEALVFGRVRVFDETVEYFPWSFTNVSGPELHLWLLGLEPRSVSPELHLEQDGTFRGWLKAGDYAVIGSRHAIADNSTDMEVLALLRVPSDAGAAYAGVLEIGIGGAVIDLHHLQTKYDLGAARTSAEPLSVARASLEKSVGPLPGLPVVSLFCTGDELPGFHDADLTTRGRSLLDGGCARAR